MRTNDANKLINYADEAHRRLLKQFEIDYIISVCKLEIDKNDKYRTSFNITRMSKLQKRNHK